ncbi:MAG: ATP-binding protein [Chitinispirillia bacterium]|nr:ATP-binding protein [Chitinispirillia bacterium]MCL2242248.1 ATP-binding protein [Chitinispirillia bacterium]
MPLLSRLKNATLTLQTLFVITAFALMVVSSYLFVNAIERKNLRHAAESTLSFMQMKIEADLRESETLMSSISYSVLEKINTSGSPQEIQDYINFIWKSVIASNGHNLNFSGLCGLFHVFENTFMCDDEWVAPSAYDARERPWYQAAVAGKGDIVLTDPFISARDSSYIVMHTRQIMGDDGKALATINLDIQLSAMAKYIVNIGLTKNSYGIMLDRNYHIIAHPDPNMIMQRMSKTRGSMAQLEPDLMRDRKLSERNVTNRHGEKVIVFVQTMSNGWSVGIMIPKSIYYRDTRNMAFFLILLGALLAAILNLILLRIAQAKRKSDQFTEVMFSSMPLACHMWNSKGEVVFCNDEAVRMYGMADKKDLIDNFILTMPDFQPDGKPSRDTAFKYLESAIAEGIQRFEWIHKNRSGTMIPTEVTLVPTVYNDEPVGLAYVQDIREQKAALTKMREADERTQLMLDATPLCANFWDKKLNNVDCNQEAVRLFGLSSKKEYLDKFYDLSPEYQPDGRPSKEKAIECVEQAFSEGYLRCDWLHRKFNGELIPCQVTLVRMHYKNDYVVAGYTHDLRELNAAIEKMREADERSLMMLDAAPLTITLWDQNGGLIDFNMEAVRIIGVSSKQEYRDNFWNTTPEYQPDGEKSVDKFQRFFQRAFGEGTAKEIWHQNTINGELVPFDVVGTRVKYKSQDIIIISARDLREINAANAKMRETDERAKIMLDATPVSCTLYDENFKVIDCNQEAFKLLGISNRKEYLNNAYKYSPECQPDGSPSDEKALEYFKKGINDGYCRFEWTHISSSGEPVPVEVTLVRVKLGGTYAVAAYSRDLRELKAMIKEMNRAEVAEESNKAKSRFLATMSHEIRTPMNVILGVTEIQLQDETISPAIREAFVQIYNSGDILLGIINDILDLSKIEAEKMEFTPVKYDLASLINDTAHLNMMRNSKPITFELNVDENVPANLFGDELRIKQILNNLLSNAFKFTDTGTIKLNVSVEERPDDNSGNDSTLVLTVSDTGQGMTPEQVNRLFTEYTRFNLEVNRNVEGTGLGMNITRRLISMMNGKITVDSEVGKGTTVSVRLPQKCVGSERIGKDLAENLRRFRVQSTTGSRAQITREYMPYGKVLVVDDVESNLYVAKGLMIPYGLTVDIATNGFEAVDKIKSGETYDIIFMDHMMPKMDGIEAAREIRMLGYKLPIVALTANAVVGQADIFLKNGFDDFISKPIDIRQMNSVLNRYVRDKQAPETIEKARKENDAVSAAKVQKTPADIVALTPELLAIFVRDAKRVLPSLQTAAQNIAKMPEDELRLFTTNVHGMKSALANIGEKDLSQMALTLEKAGKAQDKRTIKNHLEKFITALLEVTEKSEAGSKAGKHVSDTDEDPEYLKGQMRVIAAACNEYDEKKAMAALNGLKKMNWTEETAEELEKISALLLHSEFDDVAKIANRLS